MSPCAAAAEAQAPRARALQQEKPPQREAAATRSLCTAVRSLRDEKSVHCGEKPPQREAAAARSRRSEKPVHRNAEQPLLTATRESLLAATETQNSTK